MKAALELIHDWISRKMYGRLTLSFENGKIVLIRKEETIKPLKEQPNGKVQN